MTKFSVLLLALAAALQVQAMPSDTCNQNTWVTNDAVNVIVPAGNKVYIGGWFTHVGPYTGSCVPIDSATGSPAPVFPKINGNVQAVCMDGRGGWFVGGLFSLADGLVRNNIAHVLPNGSVDPAWNPFATGAVFSIARSGTTIFVAGNFMIFGSQYRPYAAAVDAITGAVLSWNPSPNGYVSSIAVSGATVFVGGEFTRIGGRSCFNIAALDTSTGNALTWSPGVSASSGTSFVASLVSNGSTVYAGGLFSSVGGGQPRNNVAAFDAATGITLAWNPNADSAVQSLAISGSTVYVGGRFKTIGGQNRNRIAAVDATAGNILAWNPDADGWVMCLVVSGTTVYPGGEFTRIGGQSRDYVAALSSASGNALAWNPDANSPVVTLVVSGTTIYTGGSLSSIGGLTRNHIAALDAATGIALPWDPNADSVVFSIAANGPAVYAGGRFRNIGGQSRNSIAALDTTSGNASAWNPDASDTSGLVTVFSLAATGATVYAGGSFTSMGGQHRSHIAAMDATTGNVLAWNADADNNVNSLLLSGTTVYTGGNFSIIGGQSRDHIAALDATTGTVLPWSPGAVSTVGLGNVSSMVKIGTTLYAAGNFNSLDGTGGGNIGALDITTGSALAWYPKADHSVSSIAASGTTVFAGGQFTTVGGQSRSQIAALDSATGNALAWNPNADFPVYSLAASGTTVYAGGNFHSIGQGISHPYFARFDELVNAAVNQPISRSSGATNPGLHINNLSSSRLRAGAAVNLAYSLAKARHVSLRLYSVSGQLQSELVNKEQPAGNYSLTLRRGALAAGAYLVTFRAGDYHQEKMIYLMK